jgi:DNA-directed RNA polymerase alpha subunit
MKKITPTNERDAILFTAVQEFFRNHGDVHEFKFVVEEAISKMPIGVLELSSSTMHKLRDNGVATVGQLCALQERDLFVMPGVGLQTVRHVQEAVSQFNHLFKEERRVHVRSTDHRQTDAKSTVGAA